MEFKYQYKYMLAGIYGVGVFHLIEYDEDKYEKEDERGDFDYISGILYTNEKQNFQSPHLLNGFFQEDTLDEEAEWTKVVNGKASSQSKDWVKDLNLLF